jgi:hypothetical protein
MPRGSSSAGGGGLLRLRLRHERTHNFGQRDQWLQQQ